VTPIRGSDVYLADDIRRILEALLVASTVQKNFGLIYSEEFDRGFQTAIASVAVAVGVELDDRLMPGMVTP
jgi:hypothetical protein